MNYEYLHKEINFKTSRSGGAGGQHVNKVATKVSLYFDVQQSSVLNDDEKQIILKKLANRINNDGLLHLHCDETRSQIKNKDLVVNRLIELLSKALKPVKKRKETKPSKSSVQKRLDEKKKQSHKKQSRKFNPNKE